MAFGYNAQKRIGPDTRCFLIGGYETSHGFGMMLRIVLSMEGMNFSGG